MKYPYQISRVLKRYVSNDGQQVLIRIRRTNVNDIEIPVYDYVGDSKVKVKVRKEYWEKGYIKGGRYHKPIREMNLLLAKVEGDVRDAVDVLLLKKTKLSRENILYLTYSYVEQDTIDQKRIEKGELFVDENGAAFASENEFIEFIDRQDDPKFNELKRKAGLLTQQYIMDYWDEYINDFAPDTYMVAKSSIQNYIDKSGDDCKVRDFNSKWLEGYFTYIVNNGYKKNTKKGEKQYYYQVSTVEQLYKILRNFGKWLFEEKELIDTEDFKRFKLRNPKSKKASLIKIKSNPFKNTHALLKIEFDYLFFYKFQNKNDELIRDLFILQTWLGGLRKSDFFSLTEDNISIYNDEVQVQFEQQKTEDEVVNMANRNYVTPIILKYGRKLPEFPSPNKYNERLKKVFEKAGLVRKLPFRDEISNEVKAKTEYYRMCDRICNKWARSCAVSILVEKGYNDHYIKQFTGHRDDKMLNHYRSIHKTKVRDMVYEVKPEPIDDLSFLNG